MDGAESYEIIEGSVKSILFQNSENGYTVLKMSVESMGEVCVVGIIPLSGLGERLRVTGAWTRHATYGEQFKAEWVERFMPVGSEAILSYLSSRAIKGIGKKTAERLVARFGDTTLDIIENNWEVLSELPGISLSKAKEINESYRRQVGVRILMEFLQANGLKPQLAMKLYKAYGQLAMSLIRERPYLMADEYFGADFKDVDAFALRMGINEADEQRVDAGVMYELSYNLSNGHTFLPRDKLLEAAAQLLGLDRDAIDISIDRNAQSGKLHVDIIAGLEACYLESMHEAEVYVAQRLLMMADTSFDPPPQVGKTIGSIEERESITYAPLQREAIVGAVSRQIMLLTGGPGTGKTTAVRGIIEVFDSIGQSCVLAAPTGRAAKRMSELCDMEAMTIHRLLEVEYSGEDGGATIFVHDEDDPIKADVVIVDETSMVDITLMRALLAALKPECRLIMVGDPNQLPSVGAGNLLSDMIRSGRIHTVMLTEIFRQAQQSLIIMNAHAVNKGEMPDLSDKSRDFFFLRRRGSETVISTILSLYSERLPKNMGIEASQIQVLSPSRKYETGTVNLNSCLQNVINPTSIDKKEKKIGQFTIREGDRVMQIRNNYDIMWTRPDGVYGTGVFNGDIGYVRSIDNSSEIASIDFDGRCYEYTFDMLTELEPAYAVTVHKSQGSEYRAVILAASGGPAPLLTRSVLYTAITRAKDLLVIVGDEQVIKKMTENNKQKKRYSGLKLRLQGKAVAN